MSDPVDPRYASGGRTLREILAMYEADGFTAQLGVRPGGRIVCFNCRHEAPAEKYELVSLARTEGASDPDDMLAIAALRCPDCGIAGTLIMNYGPESSEDDVDVLRALETVNKDRENPTA